MAQMIKARMTAPPEIPMPTRVPVLRPFEEEAEVEAEAAGVEGGAGLVAILEGIWMLSLSVGAASTGSQEG
jgi:hypothetical protein